MNKQLIILTGLLSVLIIGSTLQLLKNNNSDSLNSERDSQLGYKCVGLSYFKDEGDSSQNRLITNQCDIAIQVSILLRSYMEYGSVQTKCLLPHENVVANDFIDLSPVGINAYECTPTPQ